MNNQETLAIITGASSGIGYQTVLEFAKRGYPVLAIARRRNLLEALQAEYPSLVQIKVADLSDVEDRNAVVTEIGAHYETLYVVHNAGMIEPVGPLSSLNEMDWKTHFALNVEAPVFLTKKLIPKMASGRILHISSGAAHFPLSHCTAYCASKAALHAIYNCLKAEFKDTPIHFASFAPGIIDTPMQEKLRSLTESQFPEVKKFQSLKEKNQLIPAKQTAQRIVELLLDTPETEFSAKEWKA